jgi:hypothetical protein
MWLEWLADSSDGSLSGSLGGSNGSLMARTALAWWLMRNLERNRDMQVDLLGTRVCCVDAYVLLCLE